MSKPKTDRQAATTDSRRNFIKTSSMLLAGGAALGTLGIARSAHAFGSDTIRIGLVGCGGRGTGAAVQALNSVAKLQNGDVKLVAMADAFGDRLQASIRGVEGQHKNLMDVPKDRQFVGLDGYKGVMESDIDLVILATPPGFRPLHFEAAVKAGKHVFMEKPVAVDAPGVRRVLAANEEAKSKNLAVAVGLQRHHEKAYIETITRLQDGAIGEILLTRVYWNNPGVWVRKREEKQTELEYQMRNWYYFNWLCGDHICEQHIHNLDVINWLKNGYPVRANGMGGRQVRGNPLADVDAADRGQIFDHHFVEFTYADGSKMYSQCRHIPGAWQSVSEHAHGTAGTCDISGAKIYDTKGELVWQHGRGGRDGHQEEHYDLFAALRRGERPNEGDFGALSTMTSIFGRMATYSGQDISWDEALASETSLANVDDMRSLADKPPVAPDEQGNYPIAVPGVSSPF
ncbi:MAG: Gfo/Idh/MocA family oxidoreductase [Pirellulaceae bacterium]|nr:Gfo/Idh/MocA family oxidoreductase [Pirellulaceae bacterium]